MPVTIYPGSHPAETYSNSRFKHVSSPETLLQASLTDDAGLNTSLPKSLVKTSFHDLTSADRHHASKNGFVHATIEAYNNHQHLVIRPEDVWFAVLTQVSVYVNANSEDLRDVFVAHEGKKDLVLMDDSLQGDVTKWDHGKLAFEMTKLMETNIKDPKWREWVLPTFTTTNKTDQAVAGVIFMGTLQSYFTYSWGSRCGLPSVTVLGEVQDWIAIRDRCKARLPLLGKEVVRWLRVLQPVLDGFVESFRKPEGRKAVDFWRRVVDAHVPNGSGTTTYSGWITAFCYWDEKGACIHEANSGMFGSVRITHGEIPVGFTKVPVTLLLNGMPIPTEMIAGSLGFTVSDSKKPDPKTGKVIKLDTIQPELGWFMYRT